MTKRKVIVYIAASLDGYIAKNDGDISWLSIVESTGVDYGYKEFIDSIDTVIMGRKTYEKVLTLTEQYPHADKISYIISRKVKQSTKSNLIFHNDPVKLVNDLIQIEGKSIFVDGGAEIVQCLLEQRLIDEIIISIIPILLGSGIRLFRDTLPEQHIQLLRADSYDSGLVQLHYCIVK